MSDIFSKDEVRFWRVNIAISKIRNILESEGDITENAIKDINETLETLRGMDI